MPRALVFRIGTQRLALPEGGKREVLERGPALPLPHGAGLLLGLTALQGRAVPLLDLAGLLGLPAPGGTLTLLVDLAADRAADRADEAVAWPVDAVEGLQDLSPEAGHPPGAGEAATEPRLLDLPALLEQVRGALQPQP
ncbi:chemotaxis protein CheW [Deinococcus budaensis]|uniref:Chemotaxis signal transduction protein n=1 Tax=Deinococcus budaensis TaxID=1665626 RepID=A0A7W8GG14_9DEIO|nr:chemotaxis signal transduction protein [Deinococcus budaensis]